MNKILVTPRYLSQTGHPALRQLEDAGYQLLMPWPGRQPDHEELKAVLPECTGYLAGLEPVTADILQECRLLRAISRYGSGMDTVDIQAAQKLGITVTGAPGANAQSVAELALMLTMQLLRHAAESSALLRQGIWQRQKGFEAAGKTIGIIGYGHAGSRLARMASALDMHVIVCTPHPGTDGTVRFVSMQELCRQSDIISLHCPLTPRPIVTGDFLSSCKKGVYIVNTARAGLIEENSMLAALQSGQAAGYATDVYLTEPPVITPLYQHPAVIMTPHIGTLTQESTDATALLSVRNLIAALAAAKAATA